jgi:hypothetical protein
MILWLDSFTRIHTAISDTDLQPLRYTIFSKDESKSSSELAEPSTSLNGLSRSSLSSSNLLAIEVRHEASITGTNKLARAAESVDLTRTTKELLARRSSSRIQNGEQAATSRSVLDGRFHAGEHVALGKNLGAGGDLEGVSAVVFPVVVDGVQDGVACNLGSAAGSSMDVVALEGDGILRAGEVESPVLVLIAGGGPVGKTINLVVRDGHAAGSDLAQDDVLTADQGSLLEKYESQLFLVDLERSLTLTWSIHTMSLPSRVIASPPQTYCGFNSVMWMFCRMMLLPPTMRRPLPLMTPADPEPMIVLSEATMIGSRPASS